jgi:hypothetical protein
MTKRLRPANRTRSRIMRATAEPNSAGTPKGGICWVRSVDLFVDGRPRRGAPAFVPAPAPDEDGSRLPFRRPPRQATGLLRPARRAVGRMYQQDTLSITGAVLRALQAEHRQLHDWNDRTLREQRVGASVTCLAVRARTAYLAQLGPAIAYHVGDGRFALCRRSGQSRSGRAAGRTNVHPIWRPRPLLGVDEHWAYSSTRRPRDVAGGGDELELFASRERPSFAGAAGLRRRRRTRNPSGASSARRRNEGLEPPVFVPEPMVAAPRPRHFQCPATSIRGPCRGSSAASSAAAAGLHQEAAIAWPPRASATEGPAEGERGRRARRRRTGLAS